jgi:glycosyltransferase involved in cell wall biosynthesis
LAAVTAHRSDTAAGRAGELEVHLDAPLPPSLSVGGGTALFVCGTCFAPAAPIASLTLLVDGDEQPLMAHGMPRLDLLEASDAPTSYRAGFWGLARIGPRDAGGTLALGVRARLEGGGELLAELGRIPIAKPPEPLPGAPLVAIAMAAFEPPLELFRAQVESIRAQTLTDWVCVVSDDCSDPARFAELQRVVEGDPRFVVSRSERRRGFYHNFERALELVPAGARYVALADQDDVWDPDKLETLVREIGDARLVYSDQRIISSGGEQIATTYWAQRANNHKDMLSLLVANCVTGAASLFPRELLDDALPLPPAQFAHYHDHWIALVALALGDIRFVSRPLYDYVQHEHATLGHATATRMVRLGDRLSSLRRGVRERVRLWRLHYFLDACRLLQLATVLELRCGGRMSARKRRALDRFLRADRSALPLPGLFARGARELLRRRPETLGAEWMLGYAFAWRRLLAVTARDRPQQTARLDALPPPVLHPSPRVRVPGDPDLRAIAQQILPLPLAPADDAPQRINLLVGGIDPRQPFDGVPARLHLARRLAERGLRVRVVTVDPVVALPRSWAREVEARAGAAGLFEAVEVEFGAESAGIEVSRSDAFVATGWRTAHLARAALPTVGAERFLYLIGDYEPLRYPAGTFAALAAESYGFPHFALFSSELLRDYFRRRGAGVYADGPEAGDRASAAFEDAVTIAPPTAGELAPPRRLLFHAGPEPDAARAMFELGVLALGRALERGAFAGWTLHCIGAERRGRRLDLGGGDWMQLLPPSELPRGYDVGLAPMHAPRPGPVPIEMARAGMLAVTTTFENKTAEALRAISPNLIAAEPTVEGIADALQAASANVGAVEERMRGSAVRWSLDWDSSFDDELIDRVIGVLGR